jgi:non-canonical purine NTP pyrophosphatase (RdgB/HAM1 family)
VTSNSIIFATSNKDKVREAESILGVKVVGNSLEIDEIQSLDTTEVTVKKARAYFKELNKPVFVEDSAGIFKAIEPLPGPYIKDFYDALGNIGLCRLLEGKDRGVIARATVVYKDKQKDEHVFVGDVEGKIAKNPKGDSGWGWDPIFIPNGSNKTFGEMTMVEKNKFSHRRIALEKFAKWLNSQ